MSEAGPLLAVVAALRGEVAPLTARLAPASRRRGRAGTCRFVHGTLDRLPLVVAWTGDGARAADEGLAALLDALPVARLLVVGVAGGLSPALAAGSVVVAERVADDTGEAPAPDFAWANLGRAASSSAGSPASGPASWPGLLYSASRIIVSREDKRGLWARLGRPPVATVDLETAAFARAATAHGVPYAALRAVSDTADETLPVDFNRFRDARGGVREWAVAGWALGHPQAIPALVALAGRLRRAAVRLAALTEAIAMREAAG